jgi:paraquat-inducible protein A
MKASHIGEHRGTALQAGLTSCRTCGLLARPDAGIRLGDCPRCGTPLQWRHKHSVQRTWSLIVAAAILYIPANALPVLTTTTLGSAQSDTILSGVQYLYTTGAWPLAVIVLIASVIIPLGKLAVLASLLTAVQMGAASPRVRTRMHRMVSFIGRWSMLDVFVDSFVVAVVQLSPLMEAEPGPGVPLFMAVVVLTMLASRAFDSRLLWDAAQRRERQRG